MFVYRGSLITCTSLSGLIVRCVEVQVMHWLGELSDRLQEQLDLDLEMHNRKAKLLVLHAAVHLVSKAEILQQVFRGRLLIVWLLVAFYLLNPILKSYEN